MLKSKDKFADGSTEDVVANSRETFAVSNLLVDIGSGRDFPCQLHIVSIMLFLGQERNDRGIEAIIH